MSEQILNKILVKVEELHSDVSVLKNDVSELKSDVGVLKSDVSELKSDVGTLKKDVSWLKTDVGGLHKDSDRLLIKIINMDEFMRESMVTKEELAVTKDEMFTHIDGFIKLHDTMSTEIVALQSKTDRLCRG